MIYARYFSPDKMNNYMKYRTRFYFALLFILGINGIAFTQSPAIVQERSALVQHRQVAAYLEVTYSESHTGYEMFVLNDIYGSVE